MSRWHYHDYDSWLAFKLKKNGSLVLRCGEMSDHSPQSTTMRDCLVKSERSINIKNTDGVYAMYVDSKNWSIKHANQPVSQS